MKNLYKITKGQLISLWFFGIIGWFYTVDSYSDFSGFLSIFIPAILVFYTIGWRNFNKTEKLDSFKKNFNFKNLTPYFKKSIKPLLSIFLIVGILFVVNFFSEITKEKMRIQKLTQDYNQVVSKVESLKSEYTTCLQPTFEKKYKTEERDCNLYRNKVKHDYDFCVSIVSINSPASCLYENDYEKIDCSEESLKKKATLATFSDVPLSCYKIAEELNSANFIITEYEDFKKKN